MALTQAKNEAKKQLVETIVCYSAEVETGGERKEEKKEEKQLASLQLASYGASYLSTRCSP